MATVTKSSLIVKRDLTAILPYTVPQGEYAIVSYYVSATTAGNVVLGTPVVLYFGPTDVATATVNPVAGVTYSYLGGVLFTNS